MFCPACRSEFRAGIEWCASCEVNLEGSLPAEDPFRDSRSMAKYLEGAELVGLLTGEQTALQSLQAILAEQRIATVFGPGEAGMAQAGRFVLNASVGDADRAKAFLSDQWQESVQVEGLEQADDISADECPACGTAVTPEAEECHECGLFVGSAV